jgi:hypothetical protein
MGISSLQTMLAAPRHSQKDMPRGALARAKRKPRFLLCFCSRPLRQYRRDISMQQEELKYDPQGSY